MRLGLETEGHLAMNAMCYAKICNSTQWIFNERSLSMLNLWPFQNAPLHVDLEFQHDTSESAKMRTLSFGVESEVSFPTFSLSNDLYLLPNTFFAGTRGEKNCCDLLGVWSGKTNPSYHFYRENQEQFRFSCILSSQKDIYFCPTTEFQLTLIGKNVCFLQDEKTRR